MTISPEDLERELDAAEDEEFGPKVVGAVEDSLAASIRTAGRAAPREAVAPPGPVEAEAEDDEDEDEKPWEHETFEYLGETWEARTPTQEGLMAFALATSKFIDPGMQSNFMGLFIREHLSPASLSRMFERLLSFEDTDFGQDSVAEILRNIAELASGTD